MNNQLQNTFKPYHIGNGWGGFVDIEIYDDINNKKLVPIIESYIDDEYDAVDYYNDIKKNDIEKNYVKKDEIEELFKKIEKKIQEKDKVEYNFEKINNEILNSIKFNITTFVAVSIITFVGFCIP